MLNQHMVRWILVLEKHINFGITWPFDRVRHDANGSRRSANKEGTRPSTPNVGQQGGNVIAIVNRAGVKVERLCFAGGKSRKRTVRGEPPGRCGCVQRYRQ